MNSFIGLTGMNSFCAILADWRNGGLMADG